MEEKAAKRAAAEKAAKKAQWNQCATNYFPVLACDKKLLTVCRGTTPKALKYCAILKAARERAVRGQPDAAALLSLRTAVAVSTTAKTKMKMKTATDGAGPRMMFGVMCGPMRSQGHV